MGNDTRDRGSLQNVGFHQTGETRKGALRDSWGALLILLAASETKRNLKPLWQPRRAAVDEHNRADDQGRGEKHVERDGFPGQEPA